MIYIIVIALLLVLNLYLAQKREINLWIVGIGTVFFGIFVTIGLLFYMVFTPEVIIKDIK